MPRTICPTINIVRRTLGWTSSNKIVKVMWSLSSVRKADVQNTIQIYKITQTSKVQPSGAFITYRINICKRNTENMVASKLTATNSANLRHLSSALIFLTNYSTALIRSTMPSGQIVANSLSKYIACTRLRNAARLGS